VHVDIKKLGNIPEGGGHKVLGPVAGRRDRHRGRRVNVLSAMLCDQQPCLERPARSTLAA
jgi:hypothetical protein